MSEAVCGSRREILYRIGKDKAGHMQWVSKQPAGATLLFPQAHGHQHHLHCAWRYPARISARVCALRGPGLRAWKPHLLVHAEPSHHCHQPRPQPRQVRSGASVATASQGPGCRVPDRSCCSLSGGRTITVAGERFHMVQNVSMAVHHIGREPTVSGQG